MTGPKLTWTLLWVQLTWAVFADRIYFPDSEHSPIQFEVEKCPGNKTYCGGDVSKYPEEEIKAIIDRAVELKYSRENMDHFFHQLEEVNEPGTDEKLYQPACPSRREMIPRYSRAQNIDHKWRYLVEVAGATQQVEVHICKEVNKPCKNDEDNPSGEPKTVCKQLFRTQKLLAVNEEGEIVVDTFELPSACICNYKTGLQYRLFNTGTLRTTVCSANMTVSAPLNTWSLKLDKEPQRIIPPQADESRIIFGRRMRSFTPTHYRRVEFHPQPTCTRGSNGLISDNAVDCASYPETEVRRLLRQSNTLKSPIHFKKLFERPCNSTPNAIANRLFSIGEQPLCDSSTSYIFPKVAKTVQGEWRYIINIEEYQQGVTVVKCNHRGTDKGCRYGGKEGNCPEATKCKQKYTRHNMLTVSPDEGVTYDTFKIPSACVCHYKKKLLYECF